MAELQAQYCNDGTDISGPPCPPAYRDLSSQILAFGSGQAPNSIGGTPGYPDISAWKGADVWSFVPDPGYSHQNAMGVDAQEGWYGI